MRKVSGCLQYIHYPILNSTGTKNILSCGSCVGSGLRADVGVEALQWRLSHNHRKWAQALAKDPKTRRWSCGQPAEAWKGFRRLTWSAALGERCADLSLVGCDTMHHKRKLFTALNAQVAWTPDRTRVYLVSVGFSME